MNNIDIVKIAMNGDKVGRIALTPDGLCAFEYDTEYLQNGVSISPYFLPLKTGVAVARHNPFSGNFGVFADSLPDGWGSLLLDRYLQQKGIDVNKLTILQRLSLIGTTGRGALEYYPSENIETDIDFIGFDKLAAECKKILESDYTGGSLEALYQHGGSSGGARPKIFISINGREWLVKFKANLDSNNIGQIEYDYSLLAKKCGINMAETRLFEGKYFGVERFDRVDKQKIHTISAAGLLGADYRIPSLDYSVLLKVALQLTKNIEQVYDMFRLMIFNIVISNRDDHAKNFSFQLIGNTWKLSPSYDLLPSNGFNGFHTTTINGKGDPVLSDIMQIATDVGLSKQATKEIVDEIISVCKSHNMLKYNIPIR